MPTVAATAVNFFDIYYVVEENRIVNVWPIRGRYGTESEGPGLGGMGHVKTGQ